MVAKGKSLLKTATTTCLYKLAPICAIPASNEQHKSAVFFLSGRNPNQQCLPALVLLVAN